MPFDPSSAKPVAQNFDPDSARLVAPPGIFARVDEWLRQPVPAGGQTTPVYYKNELPEIPAPPEETGPGVLQRLANSFAEGVAADNPENITPAGLKAAAFDPLIQLPVAPDESTLRAFERSPYSSSEFEPLDPQQAAGAYNAVARQVESLSSPANLGAMLATGGIAQAARQGSAVAKGALGAIGVGFGGMMARDTVEAVKHAQEVLADPDATEQEKTEAQIKPVVTGVMSLAALASAGRLGAGEAIPRLNKAYPQLFWKKTGLSAEQFAAEYPGAVRRVATNQGTPADVELVVKVNTAAKQAGVSNGDLARGRIVAENVEWQPRAVQAVLPESLMPEAPASNIVFRRNPAGKIVAETPATEAVQPGMRFIPEGAKLVEPPETPAPASQPSAVTEPPAAPMAALEETGRGPVAQAILENRAVGDESPVQRIRDNLPDADETLDPDAVGGANNPIVPKAEPVEAPEEKISNAPPVAEPAFTLEAPPQATVETTPSGPAIAPTPREDARVSVLADKKQIKVQREFLLDAANKALAAAPETAENYITFSVPGDGEYKVLNAKYALQNFVETATKRFGKSWTLQTPTGLGNIGLNPPPEGSREKRPATPIPPLRAKPNADDITGAVGLAQGSTRVGSILSRTVKDGEFTVATDSHRMMIATGGDGTPIHAETKEFHIGKEAFQYPNWRVVLPGWAKAEKGVVRVLKTAPVKPVTVNTADTAKALHQALSVVSENSHSVGLYVLGNGKLGFEAQSPDFGDYRSEGVEDGMATKTQVNTHYLYDVMTAARKMGHETIKLYIQENGPMVALGGDNFMTVLMPLSLGKGVKGRVAGATMQDSGEVKPAKPVAPAAVRANTAPKPTKEMAKADRNDEQIYNDAFDAAMEKYYETARDSVSTDPVRISAEDVAKAKGEVLVPAQANARLEEWKKLALAQGKTGKNSGKIILSLFDSTGVWSKPWRDAGFDVRQIDQNIVNKDGVGEEMDVMKIDRDWLIDNGLDMVHGILAACPCTEFAGSGARWFKAKDATGRTAEATKLVRHTLDIIEFLQPDGFWALENPVGRLKKETGIPLEQLQFQPHNYGDPYTKRTQIFGLFNPELPQANVEPTGGSFAHNLRGDVAADKAARSETFEGFAYAFFMANHARDALLEAEKQAEAVIKKQKKGGGGAMAHPGRSMPFPAPPPAPPPGTKPADDPTFSQLPLQLPEMVQFFRMLSGGKNPRIVEKIKALGGEALGIFRYREGDLDSGRIELRADLFHLLSQEEKNKLLRDAVAWATLMKQANPAMDFHEAVRHKFEELVREAEAAAMKRDPVHAMAVMAHEIGHFVDFLPNATLVRGNIFGRMASLKKYLHDMIADRPDYIGDWTEFPTTGEKRALRERAEKELREAVQEITETIKREVPVYKELPITADNITSILKTAQRDEFPALYDWFARLDRAEKAAVLRAAMKGLVDERAKRFASRTQVGTQMIEETVTRSTGEPVTPEAILKRYEELLREELKSRGLISIKDIKRELEGVIAWWHGRKTIPAYFTSSHEMYAETFSVLMNNPAALAERAPTWWRAFNQYLVRKPAVKKLWDTLQTDIKSGGIYAQRVRNLRESWVTDEEAGLSSELAREKIPWRAFKDAFNLVFNKQQGPIQALAAKHLASPHAEKLLSALKDYLYRQTAVEGMARQINVRVEALLHRNDLTHSDLSEFMFHNRIVNGDAVQTANSQGWSPNTSAQRLEEMKTALGPERFGALRGAVDNWRAIYEAGPVKLLEISQTLRPELMQKIRENVAYSPSQKAREAFNPLDEGTIRGMLESSYGKEVSAQIFRRIGYMGDIRSPYIAAVKKAEALTRFAYQQIAIKAMRDYMLEFEHDSIEQASAKFDGQRMVPRIVDTDRVGTMIALDDGVATGWYVPRAIYETLQHASGTEQMLLGMALKVLSPFKAVLTELNFGFWPVAFVRDLGAIGVQMPHGIRALRNLPAAYRGATATFTSKPNQVADQLLARLMVVSRADPRGEHLGHPDEINRWLLRMNKHPELWDEETKKIGWLLRAWEAYKRQGQIFERTAKAMGMIELDRSYGAQAPHESLPWVTMPEWQKKQLVNELSGSPDFNERGRGIAFIEVAGGPIFANAWLRGVESFYKAQKRDPMGVWGKSLLFFGLPAAAFYLYEKGWNPPGTDPVKNEEARDMLRSIPERDKLRGFIKVLGWADKKQKKVAYIVLPFPDQVRTLHAAFRKTLQTLNAEGRRNLGLESLIQYQGQDVPGQNPVIVEAGKWWDFAVLGRNPYDAFRGRNVLDEDVYKAGQGAGQLAQESAANLTGGIVPRPVQQQPGQTVTGVEKFLRLPGVSDLLGRWVRVSNAGVAERDAMVTEPSEQRRAQLRLAADEMLRKLTSQEKWTPNEIVLLSVEPYMIQYMADRFSAVATNAEGPEIRDFMRASNEGRAALIKAWSEREALKRDRLQRGGVPAATPAPAPAPTPSPPTPAHKPITFEEGKLYRDPETGVRKRYSQGQFV